MKCTICGHSTMPGAMLCGPCRAALKRARYMSVQVLSPSSMMQGLPRRSRTRVAALAAPLASPSAAKALAAHAAAVAPVTSAVRAPRPLLRTLAVAMAAVAGLGVVAWLGQAPERDAVPVAQPAAPARVTVVNVGATPVAGATPAPAPAAGASAPAAISVLVSSSPGDEAPQPASRIRAPRPTAPAPARAAGSPLLSSAPVADAYEMVPEPPRAAPVVPVPAPPPPPPPPDRWQTMRDSLARCDREGGLSGFICDQRVRLDTCEGYWGRVPQCPLPPENPR